MEQEIVRRGLDSDQARLECSDSGAWRVVVRPEAFQSEEKRFSTQDIGRCWLVHDYCLQVWCEDAALRQQAALDQVVAIMRRWKRKVTKQDVDQLLETQRLRLNTQILSIVDLQTRALYDGNTGVLALLPA